MRINKSNLLYFFLFLLLNTFFCSCSKTISEDDIVPHVFVQGTIYLEYHSELNSIGNALYFDEIGTSTGYKGHGFIVVRTSSSEFAVFDASCTNDVEADEHVEVDEALAVCPICESQYSLLTGAWPLNNSVAKYKLKGYRNTYYSSRNELKVRN